MIINTESHLRHLLYAIRDSKDPSAVRPSLLSAVREIPKTDEYLELFRFGFDLLDKIHDPSDKRAATIDFVKELPSTGVFTQLYSTAMGAAIAAAGEIDENHRRITELLRLANEIPGSDEFVTLRLYAWRLALGLPDKPGSREFDIKKIVRELPKNVDEPFYRSYTLMGVAREMPKDGAFRSLYREAIQLAIRASGVAEEPYYRKYALMFIANDLPKSEEFFDLYRLALKEAYSAAKEINDPFARQHALIDILQAMPKTHEFLEYLQELVEQALTFFTVKKWMGDIEVFDVVDYILSAEDLGINETKKKRFSRGKYAKILTGELEKFGEQLNDTRFIETLRPFSHIWVQPKTLRDTVKKVIDRLESLKDKFHGKEIERPVFVKEFHPTGVNLNYIHKKVDEVKECVAIDFGATNTVVMRKRAGSQPDFLGLPAISKKYGNTYVIPTVISPETNTIGAEVVGENPITNIKQMFFDGNPKARAHMERFFRDLFQHIKKATVGTGWFSSMKSVSDYLYITVPIGYMDYKNTLKDIVEKTFKGMKTEFIEEPLAAAIGYQVADERDKVVMIIDFGGSTLNTMVLRLNINEVHIVSKPDKAQVIGGHDIDVWVAEYLALRVGLTPGDAPYKLISTAEEIKIELSRSKDAPFKWDGKEVSRITREELEEVLDKHDFYRTVDRTLSNVLRRAEKVGVKKNAIEAVLLTGGSSQIPSFKDKVGHIFPALRSKNLIFDHSPLSAVGYGAAMYGSRDITDRHLGMAYAVRYATKDNDAPFSYSILLEKGEQLPLEKTFRVAPAKKLSVQNEVFIELFEVPESLIVRRWVMESGIEFIKQELKQTNDIALNGLKTITLPFNEPLNEDVPVTFCVNETGHLIIKYGNENKVLEAGLRLQ